jgi:hypothetical protein
MLRTIWGMYNHVRFHYVSHPVLYLGSLVLLCGDSMLGQNAISIIQQVSTV